MGLDAPAAEVTITPDEVRRMTLRAQGFLGATSRRGGVAAMLRRVGAVQLDTISVLARSHELVAYARLGAGGLGAADRAVAVLRLPAARAAGPGNPVASQPRRNLRQGPGPAARGGPADRDPARRGQGRRPVVGLVRRQDRSGMAARHRRRHLRPADRLAAGLRPARAGAARRTA